MCTTVFALFFSFWASSVTPVTPHTEGLVVYFYNITPHKGPIYVAIYNDANSFLNEQKALEKKVVPITNGTNISTYFPNLGQGTYAISCYQDLNNNGKLDKNLLGIPSEPYGFSNNVRSKFRAASWQESRFYIKDQQNNISLRLEKW